MQSEAAHIPPKKPARSQGPRHPFDRRTSAAKRFAALVDRFTAEAGGAATEARQATVTELAGVVMASEAMTAAIVRGETVDAEQQVRLANTRARLMRELGIGQAKPAPRQKTLQDHLDEHRSGVAA